jgi:hypothetical protein
MDPRSPDDTAKGATPVAGGAPEYEFSTTQNEVFSELGSAMGFVAIALVVLGTLSILGAVWQFVEGARGVGLAGLIEGIVMLLTGIWTRGAAGSVHQIVASSGHDIANLMHAMEHLGRVFRLQRALLVVAIVFGILLAMAAAVSGLSSSVRAGLGS